MLSRLAYYTAR